MLNILLEWKRDFFFSNLQIKLHFCSDDVIFFGSLYVKCFGSFCRSPAIGTADCCMESICRNTEIPAVTVCPERDYRIFLNWSSIHLSIKIRTQSQERNSSIKCTWRHLQYPTGPLRPAFKKGLFFEISLFQLYLASIDHTVSDSSGSHHVETVKNMRSPAIRGWLSTRPRAASPAAAALLTPSGPARPASRGSGSGLLGPGFWGISGSGSQGASEKARKRVMGLHCVGIYLSGEGRCCL